MHPRARAPRPDPARGQAALPDGRGHAGGPPRRRWRAASTCSTACCPRATRATASSSRGAGRLSIRNARYRDDPRPPDPDCACPTCRTASRAYLRHLHLAGEMTAATLMTIHNLSFYLDTLRTMRQSIRLGRFEEFRAEMLAALAAAEGAEVRDGPDRAVTPHQARTPDKGPSREGRHGRSTHPARSSPARPPAASRTPSPSLILMGLIFAIFYFVLILPMRQQAEEARGAGQGPEGRATR